MTAVTVRQLTKTFAGKPPVPALRGVDLDVTSSSVTAVLGPSGCGKTTLLRIIAGFERPDAGTVAIDGSVVSGNGVAVAPERRHVGIVPQEGALFPHLDVGRNVAFGLRRRSRTAIRARVAEMLELVGLPGFERRRPDELSGGQQQRVALARALAPEPAVVLLDEPFTALDTGLRATVRDEVAATLSAAKVTAILVTHDQTEALAMADQVAVMREGTIIQAAPPAVIYHAPADLEVARFLGDVVLLAGRSSGDAAHCVLGTIPLALPHGVGDVTVMLRPEQIRLGDDAAVKATVRGTSYFGHDALVALTIGDESLQARWASTDLPAEGDVVGIEVAGTAIAFS